MRGPIALLLLASLASGCAEASGRFAAFEDRRTRLRGAGASDGGSDGTGGAGDGSGGASEQCTPPAPGVVHGPALLALETSATPGAAILFFGEVETPELDGHTAVKYTYKALDAMDRRSQVGDTLVVGPYAIGDEGRFDAPTSKSTLPGSANAILPGVPITSELTLHGSICAVADFYCGSVTGTVYAPIKGPTEGQFGLTLLDGVDDIPARPRFGCDEDALAPELEP